MELTNYWDLLAAYEAIWLWANNERLKYEKVFNSYNHVDGLNGLPRRQQIQQTKRDFRDRELHELRF